MRLRQLLNILNRHPVLFLSIGIVAYILVFSGLSFWKYDNFLYNALDLGIYTQVFESLRSGNYWHSSIQQSSYLGDHFEPFILILLPFYLLIPHPKTLLVLQTLFLALPAIPIFFIARRVILSASEESRDPSGFALRMTHKTDSQKIEESLIISHRSSVNLWSLGIAFFYLLNPLVHNINLFEFHLLPFSLIFLFTAAYFYITPINSKFEARNPKQIQNSNIQTLKTCFGNCPAAAGSRDWREKLEIGNLFRGKFFWFILFCFLALLTREDIPLIVFMFGVLALIERRRWYWIIIPMILGAWWFLLSMGIISLFNIDGGYKFLTYYSWIFQADPIQFVIQIFGKTDNWMMVFGFLFAFLFLPLLKPRFLVLILLPFLQFALVSVGSGSIVWSMHYAAYFLPGLFLASIFGIKRIIITGHSGLDPESIIKKKPFKHWIPAFAGMTWIFRDRGLLITVSTLSIIGLIIILGPLGNFIPYVNIDNKREIEIPETRAQKALTDIIPLNSSAALSSAYLPMRRVNNDSALFWLSKGFKQFSSQPYIPPNSTEYMLIDSEDLIGYIFSQNEYENGDNRIRNFIEERNFYVQNYLDRFILFSKRPTEEFLYKTLNSLPENINTVKDDQPIDKNSQIELTAFTQPEFFQSNLSDNEFSIVSFSLFWEKINNTGKIYAVNASLRDKRGKNIMSKNYPLGYGLYPASDWEIGKIIQANQRILLPDNLEGDYSIYLRLIDATDGRFVLDHIRSAAVLIPDKPPGEEIFLGKFTAPYK